MVKTRRKRKEQEAEGVPSSSAAPAKKSRKLKVVRTAEQPEAPAPAVEENVAPAVEENLAPAVEENLAPAAVENRPVSPETAENIPATDENEEEEANGEEEESDEGEGEGEEQGEDEATVAEELRNLAEERRNPTISDDASDLMAIKPTKMCFPPSEYRKQIKIGTRCMLADAIKTLEGLNPKMSSTERRWFEEHPQFKHLFHMKSRKENHRVQAMWMLLLRTAETKKKKEVWFVVNGVPIRYGLREQALISGLDCQTYPLGYEDCGSMNVVKRHFKSGESIRLEDVKAKLVNMGPHRDRLKMAVLFFLGSVICGQTKTGKGAHDVLEFFQRAVDDLEFCKKFPWGRYSFDYMLKQIEHTMKHFVVREEDDLKIRQAPDNPQTLWPILGFCIPLELLAFEAIPTLFQAFREPVQEADKNCPLMCHSTFKKGSGLTGASLSELYKELGHETIIHSIIPTRTSMQEHMLDDLLEDEDDRDDDDIAVDSWDRRMLEDLPVRFEDMFAEDVALREKEAAQTEEEVGEGGEDTGAVMKMLKSVLRCMKKLEKKIDKKWDGIEEKVDGIEKKVDGIEKKVAALVRVDP